MYREIDVVELGGTLYTPATNKDLLKIALGEKFPFLRSVVFCLEDAIIEEQTASAMENIQKFLLDYSPNDIKLFIRPRDIGNLKELLSLKNIEKIDGFSLAKISFKNMQGYFEVLNCVDEKYHIMPVLESKDIFQNTALRYIRDYLLNHEKHNILTLRIGGEDMFSYLGLKRNCGDSIHDFHISSKVFGEILSVFKPSGFNIAAPVYPCLENDDIFKQEVKRDIKEGFFGKTVIHPKQARMINELYKVSEDEYQEAKSVLSSKEAILRSQNRMYEPVVHGKWADNIIKRYKTYNY